MVGRMGDRVASARPADLDVKLKKMKEKREREEKAKLEELRAKKKSKDRVFLDATGAQPPAWCAGLAWFCLQ
jgi:hypothetical protein